MQVRRASGAELRGGGFVLPRPGRSAGAGVVRGPAPERSVFSTL